MTIKAIKSLALAPRVEFNNVAETFKNCHFRLLLFLLTVGFHNNNNLRLKSAHRTQLHNPSLVGR